MTVLSNTAKKINIRKETVYCNTSKRYRHPPPLLIFSNQNNFFLIVQRLTEQIYIIYIKETRKDGWAVHRYLPTLSIVTVWLGLPHWFLPSLLRTRLTPMRLAPWQPVCLLVILLARTLFLLHS